MNQQHYTHPCKTGEISLTPTEKAHIYVEGDATVRGKTQHFTAHYYLWKNGKYELGEEGRPDNYHALYSSDGFTPAFREGLLKFLTPAVNEWAVQNQTAIADAENKYIADAISHRKSEIEKHEWAVSQLKVELRQLESGNNIGMYSDVVDSWYPKKGPS